MGRPIATARRISRSELTAFLRDPARRRGVLLTYRRSGEPQMSPVTYGVDDAGRVVVATYPERAKAVNLRRDPRSSLCVLSDDWDPWVQVTGTAEVLDVPYSVEPLVEYYRNAAGEHPDWVEYRQAMLDQGKSLIRVTIES